MEKKNYITPTISHIGPDINVDIATGFTIAVSSAISASAMTSAVSRVW